MNIALKLSRNSIGVPSEFNPWYNLRVKAKFVVASRIWEPLAVSYVTEGYIQLYYYDLLIADEPQETFPLPSTVEKLRLLAL